MLFAELVRSFSGRTVLPVDVNDIIPFLRENNIQDDIEFVGVDFNTEILQGKIKRWTSRNAVYGDQIFYANIYYPRNVTLDWQRMICCKELLHLMEPHDWHVSAKEDILKLAQKIGLPREQQDAPGDGIHAMSDRVMEYIALAVLFPWAAREQLIVPFQADKLTLADIARLADIPHRYVGLLMHEMWDPVYKGIMSLAD